ncbi:TetR family transcriptional regulator [Actinokineospora guangxiensis]|uniref:TetR family transcriptional regulator n=1 Tax=Actinokineospora guangxiensis TaxID=1490288 RepID=A0ABW0EJL6_9PSEU
MPNPVKHTRDAMLDAARALITGGGPAAVSARAVAAALGAPSGSIYHRFPRRDDLVAAAWLRAQDRFLDAYLAAAERGPVAAATSVPTWSVEHPADAALLLRHALADLLRGDVSPALTEHAEANNARAEAAVRRLADEAGIPVRDMVLAVVDLPYAVTRRLLRAGVPVQSDVDSLARAVGRLVGPA